MAKTWIGRVLWGSKRHGNKWRGRCVTQLTLGHDEIDGDEPEASRTSSEPWALAVNRRRREQRRQRGADLGVPSMREGTQRPTGTTGSQMDSAEAAGGDRRGADGGNVLQPKSKKRNLASPALCSRGKTKQRRRRRGTWRSLGTSGRLNGTVEAWRCSKARGGRPVELLCRRGNSWPRWPWLLEAAGQGASGDLWRGGGAEGREGRRETLGGAAGLKGARAPLASTSVRELTRWSLRFSEGKRRPGKRSRWP